MLSAENLEVASPWSVLVGLAKSSFVLQIAHQLLKHFPDGVWLVELAGVQTACSGSSTVAPRARLDARWQTLAHTYDRRLSA